MSEKGRTEPGGLFANVRARHSSPVDIQFKSENQLKPRMHNEGVREFYYIQREGVQGTIITNIANVNAKISTPPDQGKREINILYVQQGALHRKRERREDNIDPSIHLVLINLNLYLTYREREKSRRGGMVCAYREGDNMGGSGVREIYAKE